MTFFVALALWTAISSNSLAIGPDSRDTNAIFRAVLIHFAKELQAHKGDPPVCVHPEAPKTEFLSSGMARIAPGSKFFQKDDLDRAFEAARQHEKARVRPDVLPRNFRLSRSTICREMLTFLAPATHGDIAFVEVNYHLQEDGAGGGNKQLIALRRTGRTWQVAGTKTILYVN
jgi:hypothetical protein